MPAIGHLRGGSDDLADLGAAGVGAGDTGPEGAGAGTAGFGGITGGRDGDCIITTGAADGGWDMASFFRIVSSQSSCFSCNSTISLESTSLQQDSKNYCIEHTKG